MNNDIICHTFIDNELLKSFFFPMIGVFSNTSDYPNKFVARIFDCTVPPKPSHLVVLGDTLEEVRGKIPQGMFFRMPPMPNDDKCLVETYI